MNATTLIPAPHRAQRRISIPKTRLSSAAQSSLEARRIGESFGVGSARPESLCLVRCSPTSVLNVVARPPHARELAPGRTQRGFSQGRRIP